MLTKQEREEIAERLVSYDSGSMYFSDIYKYLFGKDVPTDTLSEDDHKAVTARLIDLCNTSNMIELPLDKDGEVINVGDVVFNKRNYRAYIVRGYEFNLDRCVVILGDDTNACSVTYLEPDVLIHKKPVTIASLVGEIRRTLSQTTIINKEVTSKLWEITDQIEMLGDSDD